MQRRWLVTLQNAPANGRQWDSDVPAALLMDRAYGSVDVLRDLCGDLHWHLELERNGELFLLQGQWQGSMRRSCSRCNADFRWQMKGQTSRTYRLGVDPDPKCDDDVCEYVALPGELNLVDLLREDVWLAWKADVICSESCKGLCQGCGVNLNIDACCCKEDLSGHPFAALAALKLKK